jgi:hypothetical protein
MGAARAQARHIFKVYLKEGAEKEVTLGVEVKERIRLRLLDQVRHCCRRVCALRCMADCGRRTPSPPTTCSARQCVLSWSLCGPTATVDLCTALCTLQSWRLVSSVRTCAGYADVACSNEELRSGKRTVS